MPFKECDVHRNRHRPGRIARAYGTDRTRSIVYQFNSGGYRCEEYDSTAKFRICVIGDSHGFGTGLHREDTFGFKLKQHIAASMSLDLAEVNLINFSVGGASADYCVRTLYRQLAECHVDFLVCQFPDLARAEYIDDTGFHFYNLKGGTPKDLERAPDALLGFADFYNSYMGRLNQIKNALLAQAFARERDIDCILAVQHLPCTRQDFAYLEDYFDRLDVSAILWHEYFLAKADFAADRKHAGPRCHAAFAIELLDLFGRMQLKRGQQLRGRAIGNYAMHLMGTDEDWAYCKTFAARKPQPT